MRKKNWFIVFMIFIVVISSVYLFLEFQMVSVEGMVKVRMTRNIVIDFPAFLDNMYVQEGQKVKLGDKLFSVNINDYRLSLLQKNLEINEEAKELSEIEARMNQFKNLHTFNEEEIQQMEQQLAREEKLYEAGLISDAELENFKQQVINQKKSYYETLLNLSSEKSLKSSSEVIKEKKQILENELKNLSNKVNNQMVYKNIVLCPIFNGVVSTINCNPGDRLTNDKNVLSIFDLNSIYIEANIPMKYMKYIRVGEKAKIISIADKSRKYYGEVKSICNIATNNDDENYYKVDIKVATRDFKLNPNENVDIKIFKQNSFLADPQNLFAKIYQLLN